jgi:hypothetical protein
MSKLVVVGRAFSSDNLAVKNESGDWEVTVSMKEKRLVLDGAWEEKVLETKCTDSEFEKAYEVAMRATLAKFNDLLLETGTESMFKEE